MRVKTWRVLVATGTCVALGAALSACGGGSGDSDTVTLKFLNYGDWVGETEIADFEAANPGIEIEQFALPDGGSSALAAQLAKDKGVYDLVAVGNATAARLEAGNLLADFDPASVPNLANLPQEYRDEFPWGIPTDLGKVGIIYDKEKVPNPPASWKELFDNASNGRARSCCRTTTSTSRRSRSSPSATTSTPPTAVNWTRPRRRSRRSSRICSRSSARVRRSRWPTGRRSSRSATTMRSPAPTIRHWVGLAGGGTPGYIEGVALLPDSKHSAEALKFLDFRLEPETYGGFINNTGASYLMPSAEQFIEPRILDNPALRQTRGRSSWSRSSCRPRTPRRAPRCGTDQGLLMIRHHQWLLPAPRHAGGGAHTRERRRGPAPPALVRNPARGADDGVCRGLLHRPARAPRGVQRHEVRPAHLPGALRLHPRELPRTLQRHLRRCGVAFARNDPRHDSGVRGLGFPVALTIARASGSTKALLLSRSSCRTGSVSSCAPTPGWNCCRRPCRLQGRRVLRDRSGGCPTRLLHLRDRGRHGRGFPAPDDPADVHGTGPDRPGSARSCRRHGVEQAPSVLEGHGQARHARKHRRLLLVGIPATGEYTIPAILGGSKTLMVGNVEAEQFLATGNYPFGAAIATTLMVVMLAVLFASRKRLDRLGDIT
nr:extracellular solute-binding protein [Prescottella equi]